MKLKVYKVQYMVKFTFEWLPTEATSELQILTLYVHSNMSALRGQEENKKLTLQGTQYNK